MGNSKYSHVFHFVILLKSRKFDASEIYSCFTVTEYAHKTHCLLATIQVHLVVQLSCCANWTGFWVDFWLPYAFLSPTKPTTGPAVNSVQTCCCDTQSSMLWCIKLPWSYWQCNWIFWCTSTVPCWHLPSLWLKFICYSELYVCAGWQASWCVWIREFFKRHKVDDGCNCRSNCCWSHFHHWLVN